MATSQSTVNTLEQKILQIIASAVPNEAKKTLIEYCCKRAILEKETCDNVLKLAIEWIAGQSRDILLVESGQMLLKIWAQNESAALQSFFTESVLLTLLKADNVAPPRILHILDCVFPYLKTSSKIYPRLCKIVSKEITAWLQLDDINFCGHLAVFLKGNLDCLPDEKDELLRVNILLIHCLGKTKIPNASKNELIEFFANVQYICDLLHIIWSKDSSQSFLLKSVKECFEILSNPGYQSTVALASITNYIPDNVINSMIYDVTVSSSITDSHIFIGLSKMMQWLVWPKSTKVAQWLVMFIQCLGKAGKKHLLQQLIDERILQVFSRVFMSVIRESNFVVLVNMLMNYLDSPAAFYKIIPFVPNLFECLQKEEKEQSKHYFTALGELMYTLMYRFPDSSGTLYASLLPALKDIPKPTVEKMNKWLQSVNNGFVSKETKTSFIFTKEMLNLGKNKSKTGLVNLGNTCYMNSILQCLFMLEIFRNALFSRAASPTRQPVLYSLQDVFTFLLMSKRDAIAPENFVRHSRPPWFPARTQQDCCEFVHYLMDKLEQDDKSFADDRESASAITNIVEEHFKGELCVTYKCMSCGNESRHKEDFTDILLAFPEVGSPHNEKLLTEKKENPKSLKGGDQVQNFEESRFKERSLDKAKESVSDVSTTSEASPNNSTTVKQDVGHRSTFTIQQMLDHFIKPEELLGNNQYFCDQCRANVDGERCVQISKLPNFLMLSLKRFSFDVKSQTKPKLLHVVHYPAELTFCSVGENIKLEPLSSCVDEDVVMKDQGGEQSMDTSCSLHSYELCSVVVHSGHTCEAGHYYSYALDTRGKAEVSTKPQWYCFNDESTYETSYDDFLEIEKSNATDTTYILIYMNRGINQTREKCDAPAEMIERVEKDNVRLLQERSNSSVQQNSSGQSGNNDKDDGSPPPGNCGSNGSNFAVPGNRFVF